MRCSHKDLTLGLTKETKGLCGDRFCAWRNSLEDHGSLVDKDLNRSRDSPSSRGLDL